MSASATFNEQFYLSSNADVVIAISQGFFSSALQHYNLFGGKELRAPNSTFDPSYYAINNADVLNAVSSGVFPNVFAHYQQFGESENRAPTSAFASFDAAGYLEANADVAAAVTAGVFSSALDHFIAFGQNESRTGSGITETGSGTSTSTTTLETGFDQVVGTAENDGIFGAITAAANTTTLNAGDNIDGGAGIDTLNLTLSGGNYIGDATITNVEQFSISSTGGARSFDADGIDGMTKLTNFRSSSNLTVTNMESASSTVGISKDSTANTTSVTFKNAALAGSDDTVAVELSDVTAAEALTLASSGTNDIEKISIASNGTVENFLGAISVADSGAADTMTTLTATGSANLDIDAAALDFAGNTTTSTATLDASQMTGRIKADVDDADANIRMTVTTGSGGDTIDFGDSLDLNDTVDLGAGTDTILVDSLADGSTTTLATTYNLSNVEVFQAGGAADASITVSGAGQAGLETVRFVENSDTSNDNGDTYTASGLASGVSIQLNNTVNSRDMNTVTISLADASGTSDEVTVITAGTSGHDTDNNVDDIAITDVETLNIQSTFVGATALGAAEVNTIDDISADTTMTAINVSGTEKTTITLGSETTNLATFSASNLTDDLTLDASGLTSNTTFTGGSREDTFTMGTTLNQNDTIDGGADGTASGENDLVSATITGLSSVTGALNISNVEVIDLTNNGTATINAAGITGANSINVFASSDNTSFTNLSSGQTIGLGKTGVADQVIGDLSVALADATGSSDVINFGFNEVTSATLTATGVETVNFVGSTTDTDIAEASLTVSALNASTITLSGANADTGHTMNLNTLDTDTSTVTATDYRGILTATGSNTATSYSLRGGNAHDVTGGTGDDTFTVSRGTATYNVDGGAGTDSLTMELNGTIQADDIANFETSSITVTNSADAVVTLATGEYINDADHTALTVTGGNSISTLAIGGAMGATGASANAIGIANGSEATGLTSINASGFAGNMTLTFGDGVVDDNLTITGGTGTDRVNAAYAGTTNEIHLSGIERFSIQADATANVDLTDTTGLLRVYVDDDNTAATTTLTDLASGVDVYFTAGATTSGVVIDMANATGSEDTLRVELEAGSGTNVITVTNVETLTLDVEAAFDADLGATTMTASGATSSLILTGDSTLTLSGTDTDIRTINASAMITGGSVVQTGREATGTSTYTGSIGADTFIMAAATDTIDGGAGSDTLDVNLAAILGGISVDLSSTTNQIVSMNGAAISGTVTNMESVVLDGYTGSFGALVTGSSGANTITGTTNVDQLTGGAGNDTINGGGGNDTIAGTSGTNTLNGDAGDDTISGGSGIDTFVGGAGADTIDMGSDSSADNYKIAAITDGAAANADEATTMDTINNFDQGEDKIQLTAALENGLGGRGGAGTLDVSSATANGISKTANDSEIFVLTATQDDLDDLSNVAGTIGNTIYGASDQFFVVVNNAAGTQAGIYAINSGGANNNAAITTAEMSLVGIVNTDAALATGDFSLGT